MQEALHSFLVNEIVYLETEPISNLGSQCVERSLNEIEKKMSTKPVVLIGKLMITIGFGFWFLTEATRQRVKTGTEQGSYANRHLPYRVMAGQS